MLGPTFMSFSGQYFKYNKLQLHASHVDSPKHTKCCIRVLQG